MNVSIIDPLQGDFPEIIEEYLDHGIMRCIAFNRRGTLLAAGCANGSCIIWDFETRGVSKELRDEGCTSAITSICWSKYGHRVLVSSAGKSLILWDVAKGEKLASTTLECTPLQARLYPGSSTPSTCLVCPLSSAPMIVDLSNQQEIVLPVSVSDSGVGITHISNNKFADGFPHLNPTSACFSKHGDLVYVGNSKGEILIIDYRSAKVYGVVSIPGGAMIKNVVFSRRRQFLLTNSNDRVIRIYESLLPLRNGSSALFEIYKSFEYLKGIEKLKAVGSKCLTLFREFQDSITKVHWKAPCLSGDGEWVVGGSASKGEHKIYIWDIAGHLVKILEGPKEALIDLAWHPVHPIVASVSIIGLVYIWAKDYTENWSAFAPDFKELEENEEYIEREDEFDIVLETEKVKGSDLNEDEEIDVVTVEKDPAFSDSDMSLEELCFLPAEPCPDVSEEKEICVASSVKLPDNNNTESLSENVEQNGHMPNNSSSPRDAVDTKGVEEMSVGGRMKRKRRPSEKGMEMEAEKVKKPFKKQKSISKSSKNKNNSTIVAEKVVAAAMVAEGSDDNQTTRGSRKQAKNMRE